MSDYETVIGLEVHVELNTKSKMFCGCNAGYFGQQPNTHTCPICLGLPGALPYINKQAIEKCIKVGLALNCQINEPSLFERKNYFYPDLAKGFQTSQLRWPLCTDGYLEVRGKDGQLTKIRINRVHQEEDTGKLMHAGKDTIVDFNRCGVPLVEIVTEPDFRDSMQVKEYAKQLQQIFRDLDISSADMEKGDMRLEANVSVRKVGETKLPDYRVELKNINSFKFMGDAIEYEVKRQIEAIEKGEKLVQETRGWNQDQKQTFLQRRKEEANDYRYFPEPDLPGLRIKDQVEQIASSMPKLSFKLAVEYVEQFGITQVMANTLISKNLTNLFEEIVKSSQEKSIDPKKVANYLVNKSNLDGVSADQVIEELVSQTTNINSDEVEINKWVDEVLSENPDVVESYKNGKVNVINVLIGGVMRKAQGKVDSNIVKKLLEEKLV